MIRACIDTHALAWHVGRPTRLGKQAKRLLRAADRGDVEILVPAILVVEMTLLREGGRDVPTATQLEAVLAIQPAFRLLPLDLAQGREFEALASIADPFDRMIVAAARVAATPLITADMAIQDSGLVETIWD